MWRWLREHWRNGLRFQIAITTIILFAVVGLYLQIHIATSKDDAAHLTIESLSVPDVVVVGGDFVYSAVVCNDLDGPLAGTASVAFESTEPVRTVPVPISLARTVEPGCHRGPVRLITLPAGVTPGTWRLTASIFSTSAVGFSIVTGQSDTFEVVEGEGEGEP